MKKIQIPESFPVKFGRYQQKRVAIYRVKTHRKGSEYVNYTVCYTHLKRQHRHASASYEAAFEFATKKAKEIDDCTISALSLDKDAAEEYKRAKQLLLPGLSLDDVVKQFVEAHQLLLQLPLKLTVVDAAKRVAHSMRRVREQATVKKSVDELLASMAKKGDCKKYIYNRKIVLDRFAKFAGEVPLVLVDPQRINSFLDCQTGRNGEPVSARTRNGYRSAVGQLFEFAKSQEYIPEDHRSVERIDKFKEAELTAEIYSPKEIQMLLNVAAERALSGCVDLVPFLAIGAFAGVRTEEISRLEWKDISLVTGYVTIQANKAKTASRRVIPIQPNLVRWLATYANRSGPVCEIANIGQALVNLAECAAIRKTGFNWKRNALRHSYISYRLAETADMPRVAIEAGNSPAIINKHYRELVSSAEAKEWFSVCPLPPSEQKITWLAQAVAV